MTEPPVIFVGVSKNDLLRELADRPIMNRHYRAFEGSALACSIGWFMSDASRLRGGKSYRTLPTLWNMGAEKLRKNQIQN